MTKKFASVAIGTALAGGIAVASAAPANAATSVWDSVASCESGGNWSINTGNGYYGGLQFSESTWLAYGGGAYAQYANQATKAQQIAIAQKVLASQGVNAWPVCGPRAGLTKANGAASSSSSTSTATTTATTTSSSSSSSSSSTSTTTAKKTTTTTPKTVTVRKAAAKPLPRGTHRPLPRHLAR